MEATGAGFRKVRRGDGAGGARRRRRRVVGALRPSPTRDPRAGYELTAALCARAIQDGPVPRVGQRLHSVRPSPSRGGVPRPRRSSGLEQEGEGLPKPGRSGRRDGGNAGGLREGCARRPPPRPAAAFLGSTCLDSVVWEAVKCVLSSTPGAVRHCYVRGMWLSPLCGAFILGGGALVPASLVGAGEDPFSVPGVALWAPTL